MGRVLFDQWSQHWPDNDTDPFASFINPIKKYVLSSTLESADWSGTTVVRSLEELRDVRDTVEGTIGMSGSLTAVRSLLAAGMPDELFLLVDPIVVSGERRWIDELERTPLELVSSESLPTGVLTWSTDLRRSHRGPKRRRVTRHTHRPGREPALAVPRSARTAASTALPPAPRLLRRALPHAHLVELLWTENDLFAITHGRGVWHHGRYDAIEIPRLEPDPTPQWLLSLCLAIHGGDPIPRRARQPLRPGSAAVPAGRPRGNAAGVTSTLTLHNMSLERLLGTWDFTMRHAALPEPVSGRQRYERVLDGAFVMLHWTYEHPDFPDAVAVLDQRSLHYFDVRGVIRVFDLAFDDSGWSMIRRDEDYWQRSSARFVGADATEGTGENSHDSGDTWEHDYSISCVRVA